jgi:hypothetical protein
MLLYVRENEETSCVKIVHFCDEENGVPSELEANAKSELESLCLSLISYILSRGEVLDEAFPEITIDLVRLHCSISSTGI